ncbi:hypothetical protein HDV03_000961 [Kappamyces sp. JEL0829]|nr:hypothetical protein HDV03_000961 [Kappamyces sp. JEL0829]
MDKNEMKIYDISYSREKPGSGGNVFATPPTSVTLKVPLRIPTPPHVDWNWVHVNKKLNMPPDASEDESLDIVSCFGVGDDYQLGDNLQIASASRPSSLPPRKGAERFGGMVGLGFPKLAPSKQDSFAGSFSPLPSQLAFSSQIARSASPVALDLAGSFIFMDRCSSRGSFISLDEPPLQQSPATSVIDNQLNIQELLQGLPELSLSESMTLPVPADEPVFAPMNPDDTIQGSINSAATDPVLDSLILPLAESEASPTTPSYTVPFSSLESPNKPAPVIPPRPPKPTNGLEFFTLYLEQLRQGVQLDPDHLLLAFKAPYINGKGSVPDPWYAGLGLL